MTADELRAAIAAEESLLSAAALRGDETAWHTIGTRVLELYRDLDRSPVTVAREDADAAARAVDRWADQCALGADSYLRGLAERLRTAPDA